MFMVISIALSCSRVVLPSCVLFLVSCLRKSCSISEPLTTHRRASGNRRNALIVVHRRHDTARRAQLVELRVGLRGLAVCMAHALTLRALELGGEVQQLALVVLQLLDRERELFVEPQGAEVVDQDA